MEVVVPYTVPELAYDHDKILVRCNSTEKSAGPRPPRESLLEEAEHGLMGKSTRNEPICEMWDVPLCMRLSRPQEEEMSVQWFVHLRAHSAVHRKMSKNKPVREQSLIENTWTSPSFRWSSL